MTAWTLGAILLAACGSGDDGAPEVARPGSETSPAASARGPAGAAEGTPDIVLVVIDTLRADHLGLYGYPRPTSPGIDAWAADALVFDRAYAHSSWTLPSFASLLTGTLPHEHRVVRDPARECFGTLAEDRDTLAGALSAAGYRTAGFTNNIFLLPAFGVQSGFDHWDAAPATNDRHRSAVDTNAAALA